MNLEKMTAKDLRALRDRIDAAIAAKLVEEKARLRAEFERMADEAGTSLPELFAIRKGKKAAARWRDPETNVTWTGRGRLPANFSKARAVPV